MANDIVIAYLGELDTALSADIAMHARGDKNHKGFDNDSMIWYIMAWTKIAIITNGGGDFFQRADKAMMDFFCDYRQHTVGMDEDSSNGEKDFILKVKQFTVLSPDEVRKKVIFNMDRSI
jgi:hypothetical protein